MNVFDAPGDGTPVAHGKPCLGCRKRKIKCDKTRPCSNCARSKQLCTYESFDGSAGETHTATILGSVPLGTGDVHERLARLEALMGSLMVRDSGSTKQSPQSTIELEKDSESATPGKSEAFHQAPSLARSGAAPVGQILFQEGYSAYFDSDFWPGLINEIEDLRHYFDPVLVKDEFTQWMSSSAIGLNFQPSMSDLTSSHPTVEQSNILCKLFFESVNPFIRVLHQSHFGKELSQYRRGTFPFPLEFQARLFSVYTVTANSLRSEVIERIFSSPKHVVVAQFQRATQIALANLEFHKTDKVAVLQAMIHYLTFLFQQNLYQESVAFLKMIVGANQSGGFHRDPSHFPFSPWVCEIRRRNWNHICCLNSLALISYGIESCLPPTSDAIPPKNANDSEWHASRFAKPESVPGDASGIKEMTFALVNRELADLAIEVSKLDGNDFDAKGKLIRQTEHKLYEKYLNHLDRGNPSQTVVAALVEVRLSAMRLTISHRQSGQAGPESRVAEKYRTFMSAITLLEAIEYHIETFSPHNWEWIFLTVVPWLAISIVLTQLSQQTRQTDIDRGQRQIEIVFSRYSDPHNPLITTPMWKLLVQLRQQMQSDWVPPIPLHPTTINLPRLGTQSLQESSLVFNDDLMLEINQGNQGNQVMSGYDDLFSYQDMQEVPWLNTQMPY